MAFSASAGVSTVESLVVLFHTWLLFEESGVRLLYLETFCTGPEETSLPVFMAPSSRNRSH